MIETQSVASYFTKVSQAARVQSVQKSADEVQQAQEFDFALFSTPEVISGVSSQSASLVSPANLVQAQTYTEDTIAADSETAEASSDSDTNEFRSEAAQTFLDFIGKNPMERMREQILREMGLTEEQLEQLPPEERQKVEEQIASIIEERMKASFAPNASETEQLQQIGATVTSTAVSAVTIDTAVSQPSEKA